MEADSTTYDKNTKEEIVEPLLPFPTNACNFKLYKDLTSKTGERNLESQIVERMQEFGLLPKTIKCPAGKLECRVVLKAARVIDRVQWVCEGCGKRQPVRRGSFFLRIQCSLLQALQIILAWCEDADYEAAAQHFDVKPRVANMLYDKMDEMTLKQHNKVRLGGESSVMLAEMFPDCLNRLSPDTTDHPHVHRILMLADTNHIPTQYYLHVMKDELRKNSPSSSDSQIFKAEVERVISERMIHNSILVTGSSLHPIEGASTLQQLMQYCDVDMQHFLSSRIWRQALTLCTASRDLCAGVANTVCAGAVQKYLDTSLYRLRQEDGFYDRQLKLIADEFTEKCDDMTVDALMS